MDALSAISPSPRQYGQSVIKRVSKHDFTVQEVRFEQKAPAVTAGNHQ